MKKLTLLSALLSATFIASSSATAGADASGSGFKMPSKLVTCAYLPALKPAGLYCGASYIKREAYDGIGAIVLPLEGKARYTGSGNDLLLYLGGWTPQGATQPRPTLAYGAVWQRAGYRCMSKMTGLECRRGSHGFVLSKQKISLY